MSKKVIALLLAVAVLFVQMSGCSSKKGDTEPVADKTDLITRGEWIEVLGTYFGLDSPLSETPYFQDIPSSDSRFPFIQSAAEWELIDKDDNLFHPDEYATASFVAESALKVSEIDCSADSSALDYICRAGFPIGSSDETITKKNACAILEWALDQYRNKPFVEHENVQLQDDLQLLSDAAIDENGSIIVQTGEYEVGDIIVLGDSLENPYSVARKVVGVQNNDDGSFALLTEEPEIGDVFKELDFAKRGTVTDPATIQTPSGVSVTGYNPVSAVPNAMKPYQIATTGYRSDDLVQQVENKGVDVELSVEFGVDSDGKITISPKYQNSVASIPDENLKEFIDKTGISISIDGDGNAAKGPDKYTAGWKVKGKLALKNFYVDTVFETKKFLGVPYGIASYSYEVHYEVDSSLSFKGNLSEELTVATIPIPLTTCVMLEVKIFLYASINGEIKLGYSVSNTTKASYSEKSGYKKTQESYSNKSAEISATFDVGFGGKATIVILGFKIIDFKLKVGMLLETSVKCSPVIHTKDGTYMKSANGPIAEGDTKEYYICINIAARVPTVVLELGTSSGTLANSLGIKFKTTLLGKEGDALLKSPEFFIHLEPTRGLGIVDTCFLDTLDIYTGGDEDEESTPENSENWIGKDVLDISDYSLFLNAGESTIITTATLPYGYVGGNFECFSQDNAIAQVRIKEYSENSATFEITGIAPGTTVISIQSSDGKHSAKCAVSVRESGEVEFTPIH